LTPFSILRKFSTFGPLQQQPQLPRVVNESNLDAFSVYAPHKKRKLSKTSSSLNRMKVMMENIEHKDKLRKHLGETEKKNTANRLHFRVSGVSFPDIAVVIAVVFVLLLFLLLSVVI
jgi:hypothetical protein